MKFQKKMVLVGLLLITHLTVYILGSMGNRKVMLNATARLFKTAEASVSIGRYLEFRDIARSINKKRYDDAKCAAELSVSSRYDILKSCLDDQECKIVVEQEALELTPEIFGKAPLGFTYIKSKQGVKSCE
jgi:hypothetical protein